MRDNRYLMRSMRNVISIVFLTVWLLNTVQIAAAGACGSEPCCCSKKGVVAPVALEDLDISCGQQLCAITSNKDIYVTFPLVMKTFEARSGVLSLAYSGLQNTRFLNSFNLSLPQVRAPSRGIDFYIRYHQFLI